MDHFATSPTTKQEGIIALNVLNATLPIGHLHSKDAYKFVVKNQGGQSIFMSEAATFNLPNKIVWNETFNLQQALERVYIEVLREQKGTINEAQLKMAGAQDAP